MDWRNIRNGWEIPTEGYCDQPYVVAADDGAWVLTVTTGAGEEGEPGQHVVSMRSMDHGRTWSEPVDVEPADGPEASYSVLLKAPGGRIFCFYNHNTDNLRAVRADLPGGYLKRVDSQGHYVFRYSDDGGKSWSKERIEIPVRETQIDRDNPYKGKVRFFWNVGRPVLSEKGVFLTLHKIGLFGYGTYAKSEGVILHSSDLTTAENPADASWETLPDGEIGLRSPYGPIGEEQCLMELTDGSFFCVWRTIEGSPVCAYSRDDGHTWTPADYMRYADGRRMKHPRAANFIWRLGNGCYLYWFHNHGLKWYNGRNPAWLSLGREYDAADGKRISWSDPEIALYDGNRELRISYPDFIIDESGYYLTQTQKTIARVNPIPTGFIEGMLHPTLPTDGLPIGNRFTNGAQGFSLLGECNADCGEVFRMEGEDGSFITLKFREQRAEMVVCDGESASLAFSDLLSDGRHKIAVIVDRQAEIITFVIDGTLCDGGRAPRGWFRLNARICDGTVVKGKEFIFFDRAIYHWEARLLTEPADKTSGSHD